MVFWVRVAPRMDQLAVEEDEGVACCGKDDVNWILRAVCIELDGIGSPMTFWESLEF